MTASDVGETIRHFYEEILPRAEHVKELSESDIRDCYSWAKQCEELHRIFEGRCDKKELDDYVHECTRTHTGLSYCFDNLKQCSSSLTEAFLKNENINGTSLQHIVSDIHTPALDLNQITSDAEELDSLCLGLVESLKEISVTDSKMARRIEIKAEILVSLLRDVIKGQRTDQQCGAELSQILEKLSENDEMMDVVLHVLLRSSSVSGDLGDMQEFVLNWVLLHVSGKEDSRLHRFLWRQSPDVLIKVATGHELFAGYYIETLAMIGQGKTRSTSLTLSDVKEHLGHAGLQSGKLGELAQDILRKISTTGNIG